MSRHPETHVRDDAQDDEKEATSKWALFKRLPGSGSG
jgi:hypothetical protein